MCTVVCTNGRVTWENETHDNLKDALASARAEIGAPAFEDGKPIGKVTAAWVEKDGRLVGF